MKERAKEYVAQLTLEEKAALCVGADFWHLRGVPRLGIASIMVADGPHGLRKQVKHHTSVRRSDSVPATCFPTASAAACTFDLELLFQMGQALGEECRAEGVSVLLGPGVNMKRSPLGGRNFEYFSEDPYLAGMLAAAWIRGVQSQGVGASLKHFAVNSQETDRFVVDSVTDGRALRETYLRAFAIAVKEGCPWTVMTSYNRLNGVYCGEHPGLLSILRGEWGFDGVAVSDWGGVHEIVDSVAAGGDVEMPGVKNGHVSALVQAVETGTLAETVLDAAAVRIVTLLLKARAGAAQPYQCDRDAHHALARKIAENAAVLLKNNGLLPGNRTQRTAVIGALAKTGRYQGAGSSAVHPYQLENAWDALHAALPQAVYAPGYDLKDSAPRPGYIAQAVAAAEGKDIVYLFAGLPVAWESEGFDREGLRLPEAQNVLIEAVCRANPCTVVILQAGGPVEMPWIHLPGAVLMAYLSGEGGGSATASLLLGDVSPCGKLAETFPLSLADTPAASVYPAQNRAAEHRESIYIGYRYYDAAAQAVLFPFGHGLSYTTFAYHSLQVEEKADGALKVSCWVKNTGAVPGGEIVQLYLAPCAPVMFRAPQELAGFAKLELKPGEEQAVCFSVEPDAFAYYSTAQGRWVTESGVYELRIGASSREIRLRKRVERQSDSVPEDLRAALPHYYAPLSGTFPQEEFERLLGRKVPQWTAQQRGAYTMNATLADLEAVPLVRLLEKLIGLWVRWRGRRDAHMEKLLWSMLRSTPMRQAAMLGISIGKAEALVAFCNGRYGQALKKLFQ